MSNEIQWERHRIAITCRPVIKYFWAATETVVRVDDEEIGRAGGLVLTERIRGEFGRKDRSHELALEVRVDLLTLASIPYKLHIDGKLVSQGRLKIEDWPLFLIPAVILFVVSFFATVVVRMIL